MERYSSSQAFVQTDWPFLPIMVAVPVSWQNGSFPFAATSALRSIVSATLLSLSDACGSSRMAATIFKCAGLSMKETSRMAFLARTARPSGSILRILRPSNSEVET